MQPMFDSSSLSHTSPTVASPGLEIKAGTTAKFHLLLTIEKTSCSAFSV